MSTGPQFPAAVEEAIELFSTVLMALGDMVNRFDSVLRAAAKLHVGKSKAGRCTKPWSTPALHGEIKKRNALRKTIADNRAQNRDSQLLKRSPPEEMGGIPG